MVNKFKMLYKIGVLSGLMIVASAIVILTSLILMIVPIFDDSDPKPAIIKKEIPTVVDPVKVVPEQPKEKVRENVTPQVKKKLKIAGSIKGIPAREPDVISVRADINDYYIYVNGKWIWSE